MGYENAIRQLIPVDLGSMSVEDYAIQGGELDVADVVVDKLLINAIGINPADPDDCSDWFGLSIVDWADLFGVIREDGETDALFKWRIKTLRWWLGARSLRAASYAELLNRLGWLATIAESGSPAWEWTITIAGAHAWVCSAAFSKAFIDRVRPAWTLVHYPIQWSDGGD